MSDSISVGITTRDRPESLRRCLESLALARHLVHEVIVFDDGSLQSAAAVTRDVRGLHGVPVVVIRDEHSSGACAGRNRLVSAASRPFVLLLDDDAYLLPGSALESAIAVMQCDEAVAAVAFAQAEADGRPWDRRMQPSPAQDPRRVRSFIGFAHLLRSEAFRALGGYREFFVIHGEEKEYCLRLADAGYSVVFLPGALVAHTPDPSGRDPQAYLRRVARNDCFNALLNDPLPRLAWRLPAKLALYFRIRAGWKIRDPGGFRRLLRELFGAMPELLRLRKPVSRRAIRRWRELGPIGEPYTVPGGRGHLR